MIALPITVVLIVALILGVVFAARVGVRQDRVARSVPAKPGASSALAIVAFIAAFLIPPLGIGLGHYALHKIGLGHAKGREWADGALGVGYFLLILEVGAFLLFSLTQPWF